MGVVGRGSFEADGLMARVKIAGKDGSIVKFGEPIRRHFKQAGTHPPKGVEWINGLRRALDLEMEELDGIMDGVSRTPTWWDLLDRRRGISNCHVESIRFFTDVMDRERQEAMAKFDRATQRRERIFRWGLGIAIGANVAVPIILKLLEHL